MLKWNVKNTVEGTVPKRKYLLPFNQYFVQSTESCVVFTGEVLMRLLNVLEMFVHILVNGVKMAPY